MKSLRLNKQMRDSIVKNFGDKRLAANPEPEQTMTRVKAKELLADYCHEKVYGDIDLSCVPEDMINHSSYIRVKFPEVDDKGEAPIENLYFEKLDCYTHKTKPSTNKSKVEYVLTKSDSGYKQYKKDLKKYKEEEKAIKEYKADHNRYLQQVRQVVEAVNTTKQLLEVWPEAEQFIPDDIKDPSSITLPSVNIADLNSQI